MGRLFVFREVPAYGPDTEDYVTVNGARVGRAIAGSGFYCDLSPGEYLVGIAGHRSAPLVKVSIGLAKSQYLGVVLRHTGGVALRSGSVNSDQRLEVRLLRPFYGAQRVREYSLFEVTCQSHH